MLTEVCSDIGASYLSWMQLPHPSERRAIFLKLATIKAISPEDAEELASAVSLRNRLVHEYLTVDPTILYNVLQNKLPVFERYATIILAWIETMEAG